MSMDQPEESPAQAAPPQPSPQYAMPALRGEIEQLRIERDQLRDSNVYLSAMWSESQDVIASLLAQLGGDTEQKNES